MFKKQSGTAGGGEAEFLVTEGLCTNFGGLDCKTGFLWNVILCYLVASLHGTGSRTPCHFESSVFLLLQCPKVHAPCSPQTPGEHAYALGADSGCACAVPHHWSHFLCQ